MIMIGQIVKLTCNRGRRLQQQKQLILDKVTTLEKDFTASKNNKKA
jgi:uncharacterized protein Veg